MQTETAGLVLALALALLAVGHLDPAAGIRSPLAAPTYSPSGLPLITSINEAAPCSTIPGSARIGHGIQWSL